ncbi:serine/threonine-protein phosphatase 4 regulatory subunit 3 [Ceratitis capitata]|uniref:serine/threonine-protein phosphatase 4 regulatory subunit 3 n=1 Tax=Ceratitis capitata TaxID=7213 RepID=UPI000329CBB3|nr:serine/threonine-protein phosphatase 4 regulatory subunit 3 [Ceratitis capitata]XP_023158813.1 serine/threonine-protein phosphatase 4 regulatory subunit 3 [Ceratitis capitata]
MDAKNDDSAGSDSLDKSLQKKCVVDDVGQGEVSTANVALAQGIGDTNTIQKSDTEAENLPAISINSQNKTEKSAGDGMSGIRVESNCCLDGNYVENIHNADITKEKNPAQLIESHESVNLADINRHEQEDNTSAFENEQATISNNTVSDVVEAPSECNSNSCSNNSTSSSNNSNAFETKVKQISKNLKETTLAECANKKNSADDNNSTSSASSASSTSSTPECEQAAVDAATAALYSLGPSTSAAAAAAAAAAASGVCTQDEQDHRSKKVRFHPDVKENDGGNRVIPKKKKKLKTAQAGSSPSSGSGTGDEASGGSQRGTSTEDEMELDDEDDLEEEGTFSIAKTIEDAQDYLKEHPLTFAGSFDKSNVTTQSGLLEEDDLPQLVEISENDDEEFCLEEMPENGISCILGKQNKCGKVEFLLRYIDRPGLFWESEEFISLRCPNLLNQYEQCRERRQARLMSFVAKRQNLRQRYTDF